MNSIADARSDTVTKPTARMREAMAICEVGDDVMCEDPTLHLLESRVAKLLNFEKALFFPTGTMANLTAIMSWCDGRNQEMIGKRNTKHSTH
jgi:threonine aldolase